MFLIIISILLFSHIILSRGLDEDGVFRMTEMLLFNRFPYSEISRLFFHRIYSLPLYFINLFDLKSLPLLTIVFSFGLVSLHILSLVACYLILPDGKKELVFFPLFAFLTGPATSLGISVSVALSACSYIWFISFLIYYSDLNYKFHKVLFVLCPLPLFLSHELMIYASLFLMVLCFLKYKEENIFFNRALISLMTSFFITTFVYSCFFMLFTGEVSGNYPFFKKSLFSGQFLFDENKLNVPIILSVFLISSLYIHFFKLPLKNKFQSFFFLLIFLSSLLVLTLSLFWNLYDYFFPISDYHGRVWAITFSLSAVLFLWYLFKDKNINFKKNSYFVLSCFIYGFILIFARVHSDLQFYKYQKYFSEKIQNCQGLVHFNSFKNLFSSTKQDRKVLERMEASLWTISASSLIYPRLNEIHSVVLLPDEYIKRCVKIRASYEKCKTEFDFHQLFSKRDVFKSKVFNFKPLLDNISQNKSYCIDNFKPL